MKSRVRGAVGMLGICDVFLFLFAVSENETLIILFSLSLVIALRNTAKILL